ncbi:D-glycero-beta-D-manno-heptose 1-phosphate adenylyltransferase [Demequina maris]|uniref:D-glycero-beta-D-manno-heptose 1-phosphate adenylyltransferase n=1 Tax=Demequina maris TaxID=1638982 RepID=UPI000780F010|nr:D-glycero-beta-D-manno-heptose 1-phosphate adenylyltransferase [Demequina maris]
MNLLDTISKFSEVKVLIIGDVMLDRFLHGEVDRISPEKPVPVFNPTRDVQTLGGAANVAQNVSALGGQVVLVSATGDDGAGRRLAELLGEVAHLDPRIVRVPGRKTTEKTRLVARGNHLLRMDVETREPLDSEAMVQLADLLEESIQDADVVVISDYAKGVLSRPLVRHVIDSASRNGCPTIVDPKIADLTLYRGADIVTPNSKEAGLSSGIAVIDDATAVEAGRAMAATAGIGAVLVTRASDGMTIVPGDGSAATHVPAAAQEVFDVVGAGDTVVAAVALAVGAGASTVDAARIANLGAGIVVAKPGTATATQGELRAAVSDVIAGHRQGGAPVLRDVRELVQVVATQRAQGRRIGFTNGCFDIVHPGHVHTLKYARAQCDFLVVGLNDDGSVQRLKGPSRPVNEDTHRAAVLAGLDSVDAVAVFDADTPIELIDSIRPDVLVKGGDYGDDQIVGADIVLKSGGEVLRAPFVAGLSSSNVIDRIRETLA